MKKHSRKILSLVLCVALLLSAFISVQPISAAEEITQTESTYSVISQFENGENPFPVIDNVYGGAEHHSVDSQYIGLSAAEEALNGEASLKVNVSAENSRTDIHLAEPALSGGKAVKTYITSNSDDTGILLRLKINGDTTADGHKFALRLSQSGVSLFTHLAYGATLYDLEGKATIPTSATHEMNIPSGFDGFVYLPFSSARAYGDGNSNGIWDNYEDNPDGMVDYTKPYSIIIMLGSLSGDTSWGGTEVLIDDVCVIGSADGAVWDTMRSFGYSDVLYSAQPEKYTFPVTHENLWQPIQSATVTTNAEATDFTYTVNASLTNDADEVLLGDVSAKLSTSTTYSGDVAGVIESIRTNTITFEGIEALSAEKVIAAASEDYAYLKMRIKVPANTAENSYNIWPVIRQENNCYLFGYHGVAYNADGTKNSNVVFAANKAIQLPSGFDGYLYMPVYYLRDTDWNLGNRASSAYINGSHTDPALDSDFDFFIHFTQNGYNLDNAEFIIDDMEFVFGDNDNGQMPFTFDEMVYTTPAAKGYNRSTWKEVSLNNIKHVFEEDALNGKSSLMVDIVAVRDASLEDSDANKWHTYNAAYFTSLNGIAEGSADGIMLRMKLLNDTTTGTGTSAHQMYIALEQSGYAETCIGGTSIKLFDVNGKPLASSAYATGDLGVCVPSGFDGFVFFPLSVLNRRLSTSTLELVDITNSFNMRVWFNSAKTWADVDVVLDDLSYYTVADSTVGLTETDALNAIKSHGYSVKWAEQPTAYDLSFDFEDYMRPFDTMSSVYNGTPTLTLPTEAELVKGEEALSGDTSLKFTAVRSEDAEAEGRKYQRAETSWSTFNGIEGLDKESIATKAENYAYLTMRIKVPDTAENGYQFNMYAKQDGVTDNATTRLRANYGYTVDGEYVEFTVKDGVTTLPAGFNGTIYLPFKKATSTKTLTSGMRAMYGNSYTDEETGTTLYGNDYMVDFSKEFTLRFYLVDSDWADTVLYVDDILIKTFEPADFDNSGSIDADDISALSRYILGANSEKKDAYDLNGDGYINVIDVVRIKRIIAGEVKS